MLNNDQSTMINNGMEYWNNYYYILQHINSTM